MSNGYYTGKLSKIHLVDMSDIIFNRKGKRQLNWTAIASKIIHVITRANKGCTQGEVSNDINCGKSLATIC